MQSTIGFIGQGYIGKNYADDFEKRGYTVVRYALEPAFVGNKDRIAACDMVFIAVPTPTTPEGFSADLVRNVLPLVGKGKTAVIKSTILPGTTRMLQKEFPDRIVLHSPEFLSEATAAKDAANPFLNIVGMTEETPHIRTAAEAVLAVLPRGSFSMICKSEEAEIVKYAHNASGYVQIVFFNILFELAAKHGADWSRIEEAIKADPFIPNRYASPIHKGKRGAGGNCFIKDFAAFVHAYGMVKDPLGEKVLSAIEKKNIELLVRSGKDISLVQGVYGNEVTHTHAKSS